MVSSSLYIGLVSFVTGACAHGAIPYVIVSGLRYEAYNNRVPTNPPNSVGWWADNPQDDYITPTFYAQPDIICHRSATPAPAHLPVSPGSRISLPWRTWYNSHAGPILTYLARCPDSPTGCSAVDKTTLRFFPIDISSPVLLRPTDFPNGVGPFDNWITDKFIQANNSWQVEIPRRLEPGAYVLRHELIALHFANVRDGAQNYPQCFNLWVSGNWSEEGPDVDVSGAVPATELYSPEHPGILVDLYEPSGIQTYVSPAPPVVRGALPVPFEEQVPMEVTGMGTPVVVRDGQATPFPGL